MFTSLCKFFCWLVVIDLLFMFSSSKGDIHVDTLAQQLHSSGPLLGYSVQAALASVKNSLQCLVTGGGKFSGEFNFYVCNGGGGGNQAGMENWNRLNPCLYQARILCCKFH